MSIYVSPTDHGIEVKAIVDVPWSSMADAVAAADSRGQALFFEHLAMALSGSAWSAGKWAMQCRAIAEEPEWFPSNRHRLVSVLETLTEHMREDVEA